jgi:hypothetical protein
MTDDRRLSIFCAATVGFSFRAEVVKKSGKEQLYWMVMVRLEIAKELNRSGSLMK